MTDTQASSITIKRTARTRRPRRAVVPEVAPAPFPAEPHTQALWTKRRNQTIAMWGELDATSLYYAEIAPAAWLDTVAA